MSGKTVFLSYRRDSRGKPSAQAIKGMLEKHGYDVFMDVGIKAGQNWKKRIPKEIQGRTHFLLLLTPGVLDKCEDENDWIRKEYSLAVEFQRHIVPVRTDGFDKNSEKCKCPSCMQEVFDLQFADVSHDNFENGVGKLVDTLFSFEINDADTQRTELIFPAAQRLREKFMNLLPLDQDLYWGENSRGENIRLHPAAVRLIRSKESSLSETSVSELASLLSQKQTKPIVQIHGYAGSGKSTFLQTLFIHLHDQGHIPALMLELTTKETLPLNKGNILQDTAGLFSTELLDTEHANKLNGEPLRSKIAAVAQKFGLVLIVDGLSAAWQDAAMELVQEVLRIWPDITLVVSLPTHSRELLRDKVDRYDLQDLTEKGQKNLLISQTAIEEEKADSELDLFRSPSWNIVELPALPIYLSILASEMTPGIHRTPIQKIAVQAVEYFVAGTYRQHGIHPEANECASWESIIHGAALGSLFKPENQFTWQELVFPSDGSLLEHISNEEAASFLSTHVGVLMKSSTSRYRFSSLPLQLALASHTLVQRDWESKAPELNDFFQKNRQTPEPVLQAVEQAMTENPDAAISWLARFDFANAVWMLSEFLDYHEEHPWVPKLSDIRRLFVRDLLRVRRTGINEDTRARLSHCVNELKAPSHRILGWLSKSKSKANALETLLVRVLYRTAYDQETGIGNKPDLDRFLNFYKFDDGKISTCISDAQFQNLIFDRDEIQVDPVFGKMSEEGLFTGEWVDAWAFCFALADQYEEARNARLATVRELQRAESVSKACYENPEDAEWCCDENGDRGVNQLILEGLLIQGHSDHPILKTSDILADNPRVKSSARKGPYPFRVFIPKQ